MQSASRARCSHLYLRKIKTQRLMRGPAISICPAHSTSVVFYHDCISFFKALWKSW